MTQLTVLARQFDLGGEIAESYAELKAFTEAKKIQLEGELTAAAAAQAAAASTDEELSTGDKVDQKAKSSQPSDKKIETPKTLPKPKEPVTSSP
ncbi:unnamed protein product [Dibothriocephalus latus]|uniref:Uncharacterized protein n=1 Tax=Dibothriocephalus latus TaxID=60516 RepID=A0A3P7NM08_DIBLA|nr:unnamed protein product [Dibothriocephalus latus]